MASVKSLQNAALRARSMLGPESERPTWLEAFERFGLVMPRTVITKVPVARPAWLQVWCARIDERQGAEAA